MTARAALRDAIVALVLTSPATAAAEAILVRGATVWTAGPQGRLERADLLVVDGKIAAVGPELSAPPGATVIEVGGKHVTPGLIDCHSHTAIAGGVNEGSNAITAEVRIEDVIDATDIDIYRQLAGGLTTANLLHGSANAIGGQNQVIKLRWGRSADGLRFERAPKGIKFALGENPKQSNWGAGTERYPQTRMGVEQLIRDRLVQARDYAREWDEVQAASAGGARRAPPRRDVQLEAVVEILRGERLIHSHCYRQDEILMLIRLMESFGVQIASFQHVLEGYKVADEIAAHGAGASAFSDWWAYKLEAYDAIPYNGALMAERGVVVSFNSDSNDLARRLNLEAAKAIKYGGMSPEQALQLVTLNPARQLRIDRWVGSLEVGKDADFAIWNGDPLSTYSLCEQTWIEGKKYFDRAEDLAARRSREQQRAALIEKIKSSGKPKTEEKPAEDKPKPEPEYSCMTEVGR